MTTVSGLINTCIDFNELDYNHNVRKLKEITNQCNEIIKQYKELPMKLRAVNKAFLEDVEANGINTIESDFRAYGEAELIRMGIKIKSVAAGYREDIEKDLQPIRKAYARVLEIKKTFVGAYVTYSDSLDYLDIEDGQAILSEAGKDQLKKEYSIFIDNEEQAEMWDGFLKLQSAFNEQIDRLHGIGYDVNPILNPVCGSRGLVYEGEGSYLQIRADLFPYLKKLIGKVKQKAIA